MTQPIRLFVGGDKREAVGLHVFIESVLDRCSLPVSLTVVNEAFSLAAGGQRDGTNAFTYGRFLVPAMSDWTDALWMDGADMLVRPGVDLAELWEHCRAHSWKKAALVVKHEYESTAAQKYVGTPMAADNRSYPRKNWSSMIFWNGTHMANRALRPSYVKLEKGDALHQFKWLDDSLLGELPREWNWLVGEYPHNPAAKLAHFTLGIPGFTHYKDCDYADEWRAAHARASAGLQQVPAVAGGVAPAPARIRRRAA